MLITENFLLLMLKERKGKISLFKASPKHIRFVGATLMDLSLKSKITVQGNYLEIIDPSPTKNLCLARILEFLKSYQEAYILESCFDKLTTRRYKYCYMDFLRGLERQGILKIEKKKALKIFSVYRFYFQKPEVKKSLLEEIKKIIVDKKIPEVNLLCLLSLLNIRYLKNYLSKNYRKLAKNRIKELIQSELTDKKIQEMILSITEIMKKIINRPTAFGF